MGVGGENNAHARQSYLGERGAALEEEKSERSELEGALTPPEVTTI